MTGRGMMTISGSFCIPSPVLLQEGMQNQRKDTKRRRRTTIINCGGPGSDFNALRAGPTFAFALYGNQ